MSERIAVGIDAGGTKTSAVSSRDGAAVVRGGPGNATTIGVERAARTMVAAAIEATGGLAPDAVFVGAAGAGRAAIRAGLEAAFHEAFPHARVAVEGDQRLALRAGLPEGPGVALIAGTGSIAYAENGDARVRVGGAGWLAGDEGSAYAIGLAAIKLLARVYDGRARPDETSALAARMLDAHDRDALATALYGAPLEVERVAALAPALVAFADKGNRAAVKIVQGASTELGDLAKAAAAQAELLEASPVVVLSGGLLRENTLLSFLLETRITNELPGASIVRVREEPAVAALRLARALLA